MKKYVALGLIFLILIGITVYKLHGRKETGITATGTVEVTKVDVAPKVNGYLDKLSVEAGDAVTDGQLIAKISRPDLESQLLRDEAALEKAVAQLNDLRKGTRDAELKVAAANLESSKAVLWKSQRDYQRLSSLYREGAISKQELDNCRSALDVAENSVRAAESQYNLARQGYRPDAIAAQVKEVERNQAIVAMSRSALADTALISPLNGIVLSKNYQNGEYVNAGSPVVTLGDLKDCWVKIYIASTQLGLIKTGQSADVRIDSFPNRVFKGTVKEISNTAEYTPRQSITQKERANMVFAVKVKINNVSGVLKPGMPADVILR